MEDQELEALRAKRMAEMQAKSVSNTNANKMTNLCPFLVYIKSKGVKLLTSVEASLPI